MKPLNVITTATSEGLTEILTGGMWLPETDKAEMLAELLLRKERETIRRCCDAIRKRREEVDENIDSGPMNGYWRDSEGRVLEGLDAAIDIIRGLQ